MKTPSRSLLLPPSPRLSPAGRGDPGGFQLCPPAAASFAGAAPWAPAPAFLCSLQAAEPWALPLSCLHFTSFHFSLLLFSSLLHFASLPKPSPLNVSEQGCPEASAASEIPCRLPPRSISNCLTALILPPCRRQELPKLWARGQRDPKCHHPQRATKCQVRATRPPSSPCMARVLGAALQTTGTGLEGAQGGNIACLRP